MEDVFNNIKNMIKANFPLLYLTTSEYSRITQKVRTIAYISAMIFILGIVLMVCKPMKKMQAINLKELLNIKMAIQKIILIY